jgi:fatty acid-binding protein DegV
MPYGVLYSGNDVKKVEAYIEYSKSIWSDNVVNQHKLGCAIGTHIGPGAVGLAFFEKDK